MLKIGCATVLVVTVGLAGCTANDAGSTRRDPYTSPGLVMPAGAFADAGWESGRNDHLYARREADLPAGETFLEIDTREWLRVSSGRARDTSWTRIRSIRRGYGQ